jgi:NADH-quinone oxidoreductase subunit G
MYEMLLYLDGGNMINFKINGKDVVAQKGETILQVARKEGIYIPTMCYLEKTTPIGSCRLCVVEVEGYDAPILSCQSKPTDGIEVQTDSDELFKHRKNIMELYNVNHPLECGVCDKSGACDLQNKTLEFGLSCQSFTAKEQNRPKKDWGRIQYDESLCILCEKCVSTCNEAVGDDAIELHFGGYSSSIVPKGSETLDCTYCGECISVCPVGALISKDFKYTANAWELQKIPASCSHCSAGCEISYEVKHTSTEDQTQKIYRVTNDYEENTVCGAGRFGFDFGNSETKGDFSEAVEKLRNAKSIVFNSNITNEEAKILSEVSKKTGAKLVNREALNFQNFLKAFAVNAGESLYNGTLEDVADSNQVVVIGTKISTDNPAVRYALTQAFKRNRAFISYLHPVYDSLLQNTIRQFINYEVGTEEGVVALLVDTILENSELDLDIGYLSGETNVGEEELEQIAKISKRATKKTLVVGADLIAHPKAENIAKFLGLVQRTALWKVLIVPPETNSLGVAEICELSDEAVSPSVGYNMKADFVISALGGDFSVPALNQQEGTFVNLNREVVKTHVAVPFEGRNLNELANKVLGSDVENTIDYTKELFGTHFDDLEIFHLETEITSPKAEVSEVEDLPTFDGTLIYLSNPHLQFSPFTEKAISSEAPLLGSEQFAVAGKLSDGDEVEFEILGEKFRRKFQIDRNLRGVIALNPIFDMGLSAYSLSSNYRFQKAKIEKVK